jgi:Ca2+-binding RTX toxin-like protein
MLDAASGMLSDLSEAVDHMEGLVHRLDHAVDDALEDQYCWSHYDLVVDQTYRIGSDTLGGGSGNDFLVGDDMSVRSPSLSVPLGLVHEMDHFADEAGDIAGEADEILAVMDDVAHDLREAVVGVSCCRRVEYHLVEHTDRIIAGSDSLAGGDGDDVLVGDRWSSITPRLTIVPDVPPASSPWRWCREFWHDHREWGFGHGDWDDGDTSRDLWITGADTLDGGAGSDLLLGDSAAYAAPVLIAGAGVSERSFSGVRCEAEDVLEDIAGMDGYDNGCEWIRFPVGEGGLYLSRGEEGCGPEDGSGNDTLSGGDGDDILLGQGGDDVLHGDAGADWLAGGDGQDTTDGGPGYDHVTSGNDSSCELRQKVLAKVSPWLANIGR